MQFPFRRKVCKIGILKYPLSLSPLGFKINSVITKSKLAIVCVNFLVIKCSENNARTGRVSWEEYNTQGTPSHNTTRQAGARKDTSGRVRGSCIKFYYDTLLYFDLRQPVSNSTKGSNIRWWSWSDEEILPCFSIVCSNCEQNNFNDQRLEIDGLPIPKRLCQEHRRKLRKNEMYWSEEKLSEAKRRELKWSEEK